MQVEEVKQKVTEILSQQIEFEGHFDAVIGNMTENQQLNLLEWVKKRFNKDIYPEPSPYFTDLLVFFFKPAVTNIRAILTKKKNSYFLALFSDKHKYYKREREKLGF